jgi:prepilin-type N-terminal cleavage/methylation domain-containing protein
MPGNKIYIKAFSLIELLVAVTLTAIIMLIALPSLRGITNKNHAIVYTNELMMALQFARSTAIRFGEPVTLCGSKDHKTCGGSWQNGSIVVKTKTGEVIRILQPVFTGDKLIWHGSFDIITFSLTGFPKGLQGSFYYCPQNLSENALAVILSSTGRIRIANKTAAGKIISCNF